MTTRKQAVEILEIQTQIDSALESMTPAGQAEFHAEAARKYANDVRALANDNAEDPSLSIFAEAAEKTAHLARTAADAVDNSVYTDAQHAEIASLAANRAFLFKHNAERRFTGCHNTGIVRTNINEYGETKVMPQTPLT